MRPTKVLVSQRFCEALVRIFIVRILADNEDSDQTARMRRPIWVFVWRTCQKVRFLTFRIIAICVGYVDVSNQSVSKFCWKYGKIRFYLLACWLKISTFWRRFEFFLLFQENGFRGDNLHWLSKSIFWKWNKKTKSLICRMLNVNNGTLNLSHLLINHVPDCQSYCECVWSTFLHPAGSSVDFHQSKWLFLQWMVFKPVRHSDHTGFVIEITSLILGTDCLSKQCRPGSDAAERGVWSGSTLFPPHPESFIYN